MERPLLFQSSSEHLCGMLHLPEGTAEPEVGFVFAQSGARGRLGNTFHYPYFARKLSALGYPCLRFDPAGIGDSTGEIETGNMRDFYGTISVGRFVGDTLNAIEEFHRHVAPKRLVLLGVCGGAITALMAAPRSVRVDGVVLLSLPVMLDSAQQGHLGRIPKNFARRYLFNNYARKLYSIEAWKRLLTRRSDVGQIWNYVKASVLDRAAAPAPGGGSETKDPLFNDNLLESLDALVARRGRLLLLFGEEDKFRYEWENDFYKPYWKKNRRYEECSEIHYVPSCNHMFTLREWQERALELTKTWLEGF